MARPPGSQNKTGNNAPNSVATALKKQLEEKNILLVEMSRMLFDAHDKYLEMAKSSNNVMQAYYAGRLKGFLHEHGFEQAPPTVEQHIGALLPKGADAGVPEEGSVTIKLLNDEDSTGRVTSILGQPPAREAG